MRLGRSAGFTHPGRKRRRNEDSFVCDPPVFAVADGMGGAQAGEVASRLAAAALREAGPGEDGAQARVEELVQEANRRVYERASEDASASGMGTTMTLALVENGTVTFGHVGDSRAYRIRGRALEQLTDDHSLVADLVRSGKLTPEEAEAHPQRSVITRALGTDPDVDVDAFSLEPESGDLFLLCSDGLTTMLGDEGIVEIVEQNRGDLETAARALVSAANRQGGEDNITVVVFEMVDETDDEAGETATMAVLEDDPATQEDTLSGIDEVPVAEARAGAGAVEPTRERDGPAKLLLIAFLLFGAMAAALFVYLLSVW